MRLRAAIKAFGAPVDIDHFRDAVEEEPTDYDAIAAKKMAKYDAAHGWRPM